MHSVDGYAPARTHGGNRKDWIELPRSIHDAWQKGRVIVARFTLQLGSLGLVLPQIWQDRRQEVRLEMVRRVATENKVWRQTYGKKQPHVWCIAPVDLVDSRMFFGTLVDVRGLNVEKWNAQQRRYYVAHDPDAIGSMAEFVVDVKTGLVGLQRIKHAAPFRVLQNVLQQYLEYGTVNLGPVTSSDDILAAVKKLTRIVYIAFDLYPPNPHPAYNRFRRIEEELMLPGVEHVHIEQRSSTTPTQEDGGIEITGTAVEAGIDKVATQGEGQGVVIKGYEQNDKLKTISSERYTLEESTEVEVDDNGRPLREGLPETIQALYDQLVERAQQGQGPTGPGA